MRESIWTHLRILTVVVTLVFGGEAGEASQIVAQDMATARLEQGRVLILELKTSLDSESAKVGDRVELQLAQPVVSAGSTQLPTGWVVPAHVTRVRHAGKNNCRDGLVAWKLDVAKAPDGTAVRLILLRHRPFGPNGPAEKVEVKTTGQKFGKALDDVAIAPFFAIYLPFFIPMGIAMAIGEGEPCHGRPGTPEQVLPGAAENAAVAKDVQVSVMRVP